MADYKDKVKVYGKFVSTQGEGEYVVFDSRNPFLPKGKEQGVPEEVKRAALALNKIKAHSITAEDLLQPKENTGVIESGKSSMDIIKESLGIWRRVDQANSFNNYGQAAIQPFMNLRHGDTIYVYDTEILGTAPMHRKGAKNLPFYAVTEIGLVGTKFEKGRLVPVEGKQASIFVRPTDEALQELRTLVQKVKHGHIALTDDERRTLADLTLYSDPASFSTKTVNGITITTIEKQADRTKYHPLKGSILTSRENVALMEQGLKNLEKRGTPIHQAIAFMDAFISERNAKFAGYNTLSFDQPVLLDMLEQAEKMVAKDNPNSHIKKAIRRQRELMRQGQIDALHLTRALERRPATKYGSKMTLERIAEVRGITLEAHHALSDATATIEQINYLLQDQEIAKALASGQMKKSNLLASFDTRELKVGDYVFSKAGLTTQQAGEFDAVFEKVKGGFRSAYNIPTNPLYRNTMYRIEQFYEGIEIKGKKHYGVLLHNVDDGLWHFIARERLEDLQNVLHRTLTPVDHALSMLDQNKHPVSGAREFVNRDRALRRWRKMFSSTEPGGGYTLAKRVFDTLDVIREKEKELKNSPLSAKERQLEIEKAALAVNQYNTKEFVRDLYTMRNRLEAEEPWIREFMNRLESAKLTDAGKNVAMEHFGKILNERFGVNETNVRLPRGIQALKVNVADKESYITLTDPNTIKGQLYGVLRHGHVQTPHPTVMRTRLKQLINELQALNPGKHKEYERYLEMMNQMDISESLDNLLTEIANDIAAARERNELRGLSTIRTEDPTNVIKGKRGRYKKMKEAWRTGEFEILFQQALDRGLAHRTGFSRNESIRLLGGSVEELFKQHQQAVSEALLKAGIPLEGKIDTRRMRDPASSIDQLVKAYKRIGMDSKLIYDAKSKSLYLALASSEISNRVLNGTLAELQKNNEVSVIRLPKINADGTITLGTQNRVSILDVKRVGHHQYEMVTGFERVIDMLISRASTVKKMVDVNQKRGQKTTFIDLEKYLNSEVRTTIQNLAMNQRVGNMSDVDKMFEASSRAANWVRSGFINTAEFAEDWYREYYATLSPQRRKFLKLRDPDKIAEYAREARLPFAEAMGMYAKNVFQRQVDDWLEKRFGIRTDLHSVKDTHAANLMRSTVDTRELIGFGFFNQMARENIMKSVNYKALNEDIVRMRLKLAGWGDQEIEMALHREVVTDKAKQVFGDELAYLNLRSAYMGDWQLKERARIAIETVKNDRQRWTEKQKTYLLRHLQNVERLTTYDGMMLMAEDVAQAFEANFEKKIKLQQNAELDSRIIQLMKDYVEQRGGQFDITQSMVFEEGIDLSKEFKDGKITVSRLVTEGAKNGQPLDVYDHWNKDVKIIGWNAEERTLILNQRVPAMDSMKVITDGGGRHTATILPKEVIELLAGQEGIHAILPEFEKKKKQFGTELNKWLALAANEAKRQIVSNKMITAGSVLQDQLVNDTLEKIAEHVRGHLNLSTEEVRVENGQIVLSSQLGRQGMKIEGQKIKDMMKAIQRDVFDANPDFRGKVDLLGQKGIAYGQVGIGIQNIHTWENSIGFVEGHRFGLVRYGRKEIDMVTERANQILEGKSAVVNWLRSHVEAVSDAQNRDAEKIRRNLIKVNISYRDVVDEGDVIIRTRGADFETDAYGRPKTKIVNGHYEVPMHMIMDLPQVTQKGQVLTAGEYTKTIVDFGRAGDEVFREQVAKKGTVLFELPDDTFSRRYVRFMDFGDIQDRTIAEAVNLKEVEKHQRQIWRLSKEYMDLGKNDEFTPEEIEERQRELRDRIEAEISAYDEKINHMVTSARDGSITKTYGSAMMDMSGRFRIQGVNPFANYERQADGTWKQVGKYKEGHVYIGRKRFLEMIEGQERKIAADIFGMDAKQLKKMSIEQVREAIVQQMLDPDNKKGLYGFVNRYPTINQSTIQAMRIMIDDTLPNDFRGAMLTVGTAQRLKADYDGDFLSIVLAHYSSDNAKAIHGELQRMAQAEAVDSTREAQKTLTDLYKEAERQLQGKGLTVQELSHQEVFETATSIWENIRSREARLGKQLIGIVDNTRDKVWNLAQITYETLANEGRLERRQAQARFNYIENFMREFSQDLISSKKFDPDQIRQELAQTYSGEELDKKVREALDRRWELVYQMNEAILDPDRIFKDESGRQRTSMEVFLENNRVIQLFSDEEAKRGFREVQFIHRLNEAYGGFRNESLQIGVSEGLSLEQGRKLLEGKGIGFYGTTAMRNLARDAEPEVRKRLEASFEQHTASILEAYDRMHESSYLAEATITSEATDSILTRGKTMAEEAGEKFGQLVERFTSQLPSGLRSFGGIRAGAALFGGLWAMSAMMRSGPTPEALQEQTTSPAPPPPAMSQAPTARITKNPQGEYINIQIKAKDANNMSQDEIAALVQQELASMTAVNMNMNLNVSDNTQNIDPQWIQGVVANAISKGFAF